MTDQEAAYDPNTDVWTFEVTDLDGTVLMFQIPSHGVVGIIKAIKRETIRRNIGKPFLRLIHGEKDADSRGVE